MAGKNQVTITFAGDAAQLDKAAEKAAKATAGVGDAAAKAGKQSEAAGKSTVDYAGHLAKVTVVARGMTDLVESAGSAVSDLANVQNQGKERAAAHARALLDVEQAGLDARQAIRDLSQATLDLGQAQVDIDQANLDAKVAQEAYTQAVKEHGVNSNEARQASIDLKQAQQDLKQANEDAAQAQEDQKQAALDGKTAMQDLADSQREAANTASGWRANVETASNVATALAGTIGLAVIATDALKLSTLGSIAATVASRAAQIAVAAATGIATAAQWAWNVAMDANPIGLIILAVGALVAAIVLIATKTTWFQDLWRAAWGGIKSAAEAVWNWLKQIPGWTESVFSRIASVISAPYRYAFNLIASAWNNTIGRLHFTIPGWVPGIGGNSISVPQLPHFHTGGVVPGAPGSETLAVLQAGERVVPAGSGGTGGQLQMVFGGNVDSAYATQFMNAMRTGMISLNVNGAVVTVG